MAMVSWMLQQPVALTWAMKVKKKTPKNASSRRKGTKEVWFLVGESPASKRKAKLNATRRRNRSQLLTAPGWREKMREGAMTHRVGVLVASELHQRRAVPPLPGSGGALASTTLTFLRLHAAAAAAVLPRADPAAGRDVFLVAVSCGGGGSAVAGKTVRKWETCLSSRCPCCTVFISSTLEEKLFGAQAMRSSLALLFLLPFPRS